MGILDEVPGYSNLPGYQNPLGSGASPIGTGYDWGSFSRGIDWNQTPSVANPSNRWGDAARAAASWLNSKENSSRTPYTSAARGQQQQYGGSPGAFQVSPEISVIQQSAQPKKITSTTTGGSSKSGLGGAIGSIGGAVLGSFIPGVGTGLGASLGGGIGSMFG